MFPVFRSFLFIVICLFATSATGQVYNYYYGNLHAHTGFSDGNKDKDETGVKDPAGSFAFAKKSQNFNFLGISEHNHKQAKMQLANYSKGVAQTNQANSDGEFVCMYGMEFGVISSGGHVLIYGIDELIGWETDNFDIECGKTDYSTLWSIINDHPGAFATLAHPEKTDYNSLLTKPYSKAADKAICGVAINTGPAFAEDTTYDSKPAKRFVDYYRGLLASGYHVGPTIDHDNHNLTFGRMASSRTVVLARSLERDSIMDAYKKMRFFASEDWNTKVNFTINGFPMGAQINTKKAVTISVRVTDPDAGDDVKSIKIMFGSTGSKTMSTLLTGGSVTNTANLEIVTDAKKGSSLYYYAEITQKDGNRMYTSPIWVRRL
jgi:hypothetical protein